MDISKIDKNFSTTRIDDIDVEYFNIKEQPFAIEGLAWMRENNNDFYRLPRTLTEKDVNPGALHLANHTTGAAVRFRTDSPIIALRAKLAYSYDMNHMPRTGSAGIDSYCYADGEKITYNKTFHPDPGMENVADVQLGIADGSKVRNWLCNLPLYGGVANVEIGIKKGCVLEAPLPHKVELPVLFYGSSITQGGCASRPGNAYTSMLCRAVDAEQINLGFSGSGKGEEAMAKAIAQLKLSCFVLDYDHNAPTPEYLAETHEKFFRIVRDAQPELPIIMLSRCNFYGTETDLRRREIIRNTWQNAVDRGDKKVWFIDGEKLFEGDLRDSCTVDGCHPNDLGFFRMYTVTLPVLKEALNLA